MRDAPAEAVGGEALEVAQFPGTDELHGKPLGDEGILRAAAFARQAGLEALQPFHAVFFAVSHHPLEAAHVAGMVGGDGVVFRIVKLTAEVGHPGPGDAMTLAQVEQPHAVIIAVGVFDRQQLGHLVQFGDIPGADFRIQANFFKVGFVPGEVVNAEAAGRGVEHAIYNAPVICGWRQECLKGVQIFLSVPRSA